MSGKQKKRILLWAALAIVLTALIVWIVRGNQALELNTYTVFSSQLPESFDGYRIAQVSDLHNAQMGAGNARLLELLRQAQPDLIAITGDLVDSRRTDLVVAAQFAGEAAKIAPCYYVPGNHEARLAQYSWLKEELTRLGVTVLENSQVSLGEGVETLTLAGVVDPLFLTQVREQERACISGVLEQMLRDTEGYTVLLSHRPELFETYGAHGLDLVLSGHAHGGQFRLPLLGGVLVPNQGFFPHYDAGLFTQGRTSMVVSRGIGNSRFPFRLNNPPEVVLVELRSGA